MSPVFNLRHPWGFESATSEGESCTSIYFAVSTFQYQVSATQPTRALRCVVLRQADVLVDKAPLRRGNTTPACLMELARVRSDTRTDGGAGVSRLGVIGPTVDRLVNLLLVSYEYIVCLGQHVKLEASHSYHIML